MSTDIGMLCAAANIMRDRSNSDDELNAEEQDSSASNTNGGNSSSSSNNSNSNRNRNSNKTPCGLNCAECGFREFGAAPCEHMASNRRQTEEKSQEQKNRAASHQFNKLTEKFQELNPSAVVIANVSVYDAAGVCTSMQSYNSSASKSFNSRTPILKSSSSGEPFMWSWLNMMSTLTNASRTFDPKTGGVEVYGEKMQVGGAGAVGSGSGGRGKKIQPSAPTAAEILQQNVKLLNKNNSLFHSIQTLKLSAGKFVQAAVTQLCHPKNHDTFTNNVRYLHNASESMRQLYSLHGSLEQLSSSQLIASASLQAHGSASSSPSPSFPSSAHLDEVAKKVGDLD